jgi:hypothetical protein
MKIVAAAIAAMLAASAAHAVTFTSTPGPDSGIGPGQKVVVDFTNPNAAGYTWSAGVIATNTGTISGTAAAPLGDATKYGYVSTKLSSSFATLSTPHLKSISFYWGSIDTYNYLDVLGPGNSVLLTIQGTDFPQSNGAQDLSITNRRVFINAGAGQRITGLKFRAEGVAFEFDTIAADAVPEPQAWALLIAGFGLVGLTARRQRRLERVVA